MLFPLYASLLALLVTLVCLRLLLVSHVGQRVQDIPNTRSLHQTPVPRVGGIALMTGMLAGWGLVFAQLMWWFCLPVLVLFVFSLLDDVRGLPVGQRLLAHILAAAMMVAGSGVYGHGLLLTVLVLLGLVWMTNLFNFMDGSDGLAGGMACIGFATYGLVSLWQGNAMLAVLGCSVAAASLGFLVYNFHPARVFMGDAGSIPLGFMAAAMGVWGWELGQWPLWFPVLVFSPFIIDATLTLVRRLLRGEVIWQAHHGHYYQRLVRMGWGHRKTAIFYHGLMLSVAASAVLLLDQPGSVQVVGLGIWSVLYILLAMWVDRLWKSFHKPALE